MEQEEYELVPVHPIRRMEKRMEKLERNSGSSETVKELVDVVRANQQIVDEVVRINSEIVGKVNELTESVNRTISKIDEFLSRVEVAGGEETEATTTPVPSDVNERIEKLEKRINALILSAMAKKGIRRPVPA